MLISNSARFSWIPGSEPIHLDLEKLFLLSDSMESFNSNRKVEISDPKIYGAFIALVVGFYSRNVIATIVSGLLSYWFIIFFLLR